MSIGSREEARIWRVPGPVQQVLVPFMLRVLDNLQQFVKSRNAAAVLWRTGALTSAARRICQIGSTGRRGDESCATTLRRASR